jgi:predicted nucleic acid-binding protein
MAEEINPVAYLDTNVFLYAIEGPETISLPIKQLFVAARARPGALITSELTLAEVLGPSDGQARPDPIKRLYLDLMVWSRFIDLHPVSRRVLYETAELRRFAPLKLPDAIHLATAILAECRFFISRDRHFNRMPDWMQRIDPGTGDIAKVVGALQ